MIDAQRDTIVTEARHYVETIGIWVRAEQALRDCHIADGYEAWATAGAVVHDAMAEHVLAELALIRAVKA